MFFLRIWFKGGRSYYIFFVGLQRFVVGEVCRVLGKVCNVSILVVGVMIIRQGFYFFKGFGKLLFSILFFFQYYFLQMLVLGQVGLCQCVCVYVFIFRLRIQIRQELRFYNFFFMQSILYVEFWDVKLEGILEFLEFRIFKYLRVIQERYFVKLGILCLFGFWLYLDNLGFFKE